MWTNSIDLSDSLHEKSVQGVQSHHAQVMPIVISTSLPVPKEGFLEEWLGMCRYGFLAISAHPLKNPHHFFSFQMRQNFCYLRFCSAHRYLGLFRNFCRNSAEISIHSRNFRKIVITRGGWAVPSSASKAQAFWVQWSYFLVWIVDGCIVELLNG